MRRFAPLVPHRGLVGRLFLGLVVAVVAAFTTIQAQIPGRNVNMVSGTSLYGGDPFLQRQNEPSIAASTRNPLHLLGGSNDYRTVDLPFPADGDAETGDAWLGLFKSLDGGQRWTSTLLPGYPQDDSDAGKASPLSKKHGGGYQAGADAVVRAGTNGLVYFSGLAFDRGEGGKSGIFLSRFIDNNNREAGDPFAYLGTVMIAKSTPGRFLDKPWMAVDIPRADSPTCTITAANTIETSPRSKPRVGRGRRGGRGPNATPAVGQRIKAGAVYVAYTSFTGADDTLRAEIFMTRSVDCGATWSTPFRVSGASDPLNQGASLTIDPRDGSVFVAWRRFANLANPDQDGIMVARLPYGGKKLDAPGRAHAFPRHKDRKVGQSLHRIFEHGRVKARPSELADISEFDQGSSSYSFRTNAYPTTATDGTGRVYIAWTQRGFPTGDPTAPDSGARIMMVTARGGRNFTPASAVDDSGQLGHQLMPSLAFGGGKLMLVYYDLRETRADRHGKYVTDAQGGFNNTGLRQTIDIRAAMAAPGDYPNFGNGLVKSVKVSDYLMGVNSKTNQVQALQVNPPNLPMFRQGTTPFIGDYIDVAVAPAFILRENGRWAYNTGTSIGTPVFHAAWTDNRDVRPPSRDMNNDGNLWNDYTPANMRGNAPPRTSLSSIPGLPGIPVPTCEDGNAGSRNQNVYSARITGGLLAGSPGNAKPLGYVTDASGIQKLIQRGFVVFAQNATAETRSFRMSIRSQPVGGRASFEQFGVAQLPLTSLEMKVPPRSTASRTVYATSTDPDASIAIDVTETTPPDLNGVAVSLGLSSVIVLNPDIENPDIENPDIENPDIENPDIENTEVYNPDIENPDIENPDIENVRVANPDIENPDIENPDIENPDIENVRVANPDIENLTITNPDIENPDIENPDIENPDIENPDIENGAVADVTWKVSNTGNTTAAFNVNVFLAQQNLPQGVKTQLILFKTYRTPVTVPNKCQLGYQTRNVLVANILNPTFIQPSSGGPPDQNDPSEKNASMWLAPGEEGRITLRVIHDDLPQNLVTVTNPDGTTKLVYIDAAFAPTTSSTPTISSQGVGTEDAAVGQTDPPLVTPTGSNLFFLQMPTNAVERAAIAPAVSVQVRDNLTGTPVPGATVALSLGSAVLDASLTGNVAVSDAIGIATFPSLSVSLAGSGYTLVASATTAGVAAAAVSTPFDVVAPLVVTTTSIPDGIAGLVYLQTLQSSGGTGTTRTWSLTGGALPPGLTLEAMTGKITGTLAPATRGSFAFTVQVADNAAPQYADTQSLSLLVTAQADLSITAADAPDPAVAGENLSYAIEVVNSGPSTATGVMVTDLLPAAAVFVSASPGCVLAAGQVNCPVGILAPGATAIVTVVLRPTKAGVLGNTVGVTALEADPISGNNTATASTTVTSPVDIAMPSQSERTAQAGVPYQLTLTASGGIPPYSWSLVGGALPLGLSLNAVTGVISGTATTIGACTFTVRAQDTVGAFATRTLCVNVVTPPAANLATKAVGDDGGPTVSDLITSLLGDGVAVFNVELKGAAAGAGVFEGGTSSVGFAQGIVLSSGNVNGAKGPNDSDNTTANLGTPGDPDLTALAGQSTFDATVIEFDFVPSGNQVSFRYVFGSEEYNEYVASAYNDAFGFFIRHPGETEYRNWALVPGTTLPVTINTINGGHEFSGTNASHPTLYRNNDLSNGGGSINIEADGLTVVLTLTATVTPGASHHMKLAIADAFDSNFDSWVFIEGGSFHAVENCTNGIDDDGDGLVDGLDPDCQVCPDPNTVVVTVPGTAGGLANGSGTGTAPVAAFTLALAQTVTVSAAGGVTWYPGPQTSDANGGLIGTSGDFLEPSLPAISLVARINGGPWQLVGTGPTILGGPGISGLIEFAVNDSDYSDNGGSWTVTIQR